MRHKYNAVGAYIYAGGFTLGMRKYFNILAHLEDGHFGVDTVKANPQVIGSFPIYEDPAHWPLATLRGLKCHVCYANPPCAPWSSAGSRKEVNEERTGDHRTLTLLMEELDPTIWVWESVTGAYLGKDTRLSEYVTDFAMSLGYSVYHFLHDAKFMGLPQQRRRVFTIASKVRIPFVPPTDRIVSMGEALSSVDDPGVVPMIGYKFEKYIPLTKQGERLRKVVIEHEGRPAPGFLIHRGTPEFPSRTMLGGVHIIHPHEDRFLGHKESAAICGYPPDYEFVLGKGSGTYEQQIARAVTPKAGEYLGRTLWHALEQSQPFRKPEEIEISFMANSHHVQDLELVARMRQLR